MASFAAAHRYQLLAITTIIIALAPAVVESTRVSTPIEIYPSCKTTLMPKRCSMKLVDLNITLSEATAMIAQLISDKKLRSGTCITECDAVVETAATKVLDAVADEAALRQLKGYLEEKVHDASKLVDAAEAMTAMANLLKDLLDGERTKEKEAEAATMEKSLDSGILHVSCGLTKQPQKCVDELKAVVDMTGEADHQALKLQIAVKPEPALNAFITGCTDGIMNVNEQLTAAGTAVKNLADVRALIHSYVQGDGKQPPRCKYSCPPPTEKPCSANETAVVDKLNGVHNAWVALDKFLAEEI
ncbi:hypothetical protein BS78_05G051000 [Paspalum vaginatum]|nr:hypothetical protein BS78_05G051000 [Paspalum vaginatum]